MSSRQPSPAAGRKRRSRAPGPPATSGPPAPTPDLEQKVRELAAQVEASNKELEAFCYSVSHDLRAPLRSIDGFTHAILESFGHTLDPVAREYLNRVRNASQRMTQLIEDLLHLSRVGRREMHLRPVDLGQLAASVAHDLQQANPARTVRFSTVTGVLAQSDERLMRIALENLLGNAWKFTSKTPQAEVQFGVNQKGNATVFFVRDNGAGFDMTYVDKLFTPFQRLHATSEFPGSGIGLAIVQRIINRHGGRIWAEGTPQQGATFSFVLPP